MKHFSAALLLSLTAAAASAQSYCSPVFPNGCFTWNTQSVAIGTLDWIYDGVNCTTSDYTGLSTTVDAGENVGMTVVSGIWCGCAVWVDFDNSYSFEESENLYSIYVGADPSYTYDFQLAIPASVPTGSYRMRVISPWGSDGVTPGGNGSGPCGDYMYGNFQDFTMNVVGVTGMEDNTTNAAGMSVGPNPTDGALTLTSAEPLERITVLGADGRIVRQQAYTTGTQKVDLDLASQPDGIYLVECLTGSGVHTVRVVKQ